MVTSGKTVFTIRMWDLFNGLWRVINWGLTVYQLRNSLTRSKGTDCHQVVRADVRWWIKCLTSLAHFFPHSQMKIVWNYFNLFLVIGNTLFNLGLKHFVAWCRVARCTLCLAVFSFGGTRKWSIKTSTWANGKLISPGSTFSQWWTLSCPSLGLPFYANCQCP